MTRKHDVDYGCPIETALDIIGGKWKGMVIYRLLDGTARFNELKRLMPKVTQRVLTLQLRELERDGVIERKVYPEVPPKVEYSLTEFGRGLKPIFAMMSDWGERYCLIRGGLLRGGEEIRKLDSKQESAVAGR